MGAFTDALARWAGRAPAATPAPTAAGVLGVQNRYDAGGSGRRLAGWNPPSSGPSRATDGLVKIRDRARDSSRNDWAGASGIQKWTTNLVGWGITPRWKTKAIGDLWRKSVPEMDADGVCDAYALQTLAVRSWLDSGEVFMRRRPRAIGTSNLAVPLQVQLIESDYCPLFDADAWPGMPPGNTIKQGIERDRYGMRRAYWMYREHPGDGVMGRTPSVGELIRVAASEISHVFEPKRPGQMRGVSELAPVLVKLRNSMDFEDAVLDRQKLANLFTLFITRQLPENFSDVQFDPVTGLPTFYDNNGAPMAALEPGLAQELKPGEDVKFANPPEAGTTYTDYARTTHMGTAAGAGLPYELFAGDLLNISDRTLRIAVNEFRRFAESRQYQTCIPRICQPMVEWWADAAVLAGVIPRSALDEARTPEWAPHGWPDIHPTQDIEGRIAARDAGFTSTSAIIARNGDDPAQVLEQRKADEKSGLTPPPPVKPAAPGAEPPPPKPGMKPKASLEDHVGALVALQASAHAQPQGPSAVENALASMQAFMAQQQQGMAALMASFAEVTRTLAAKDTTVNVVNDVKTPEVHNHVEAGAAPVVNLTNEVKTPEVHNHVAAGAAPVVNVTNEVKPAEVVVDVNLPERQITSVIERNRDGDITNVTQTEKTVQH